MSDPQQQCILLHGPTASGKTGLAIRLAQAMDGVVINADSMQLYRGMPVITAVPTPQEQAQAPHRLYEVLDPSEPGNVTNWRALAVAEMEAARIAGKTPILCGGTGFYLKAMVEGISPIPDVEPDIRATLRQRREAEGLAPLEAELAQHDPELAARLNPGDAQRVLRGLEVWHSSGKPLSWWQARPLDGPPPGWGFTLLKLLPDRDWVYDRCNRRFQMMLDDGAIEEVEQLATRNLPPNLPAMRAIGVPEMLAMQRGDMSLEDATASASQATRNYAKRQYTFARNQMTRPQGALNAIHTLNTPDGPVDQSILPAQNSRQGDA
ncbi:MAG: tRNA (adenosine(37)-N6)-dimethylallyltransferase MiaA [Alphaproteobacteria bacterium]